MEFLLLSVCSSRVVVDTRLVHSVRVDVGHLCGGPKFTDQRLFQRRTFVELPSPSFSLGEIKSGGGAAASLDFFFSWTNPSLVLLDLSQLLCQVFSSLLLSLHWDSSRLSFG